MSDEANLESKVIVPREFHINRDIRQAYHLEKQIFSLTGDLIFTDEDSIRELLDQLNKTRPKHEQWMVSDFNAAALIHEIFHYVVGIYHQQNSSIWTDALLYLNDALTKQKVDQTIYCFAGQFPSAALFNEEIALEKFLSDTTEEGRAHRYLEIEEMMLHHFTDYNKAAAKLSPLYESQVLKAESGYSMMIDALEQFFYHQKPFGPDECSLFLMLKTPLTLHPHNFYDQLQYIYDHWGYLLNKNLLNRILQGFDLIKEDHKFGHHGGNADMVAPSYGLSSKGEIEAFSPDQDWMPKVAMLAKNSLVWLDQLSKKYKRPIKHLGDIPDEELSAIAGRGFNALWLIGLWQRSYASKRIKQVMGNSEAEASAYSLDANEIADSLGGWASLEQLRAKAAHHGIRLASDMVPNHTGMDSRWVVERPELFLQLEQQPFSQYSFNGENLSQNSDIGIYLEDHYYSKEDASVVFKRVDFRTGDVRYLYHGNDGTATPWNDTAQIDFLNPLAREAVIQEIIHIAQNFPIIRFDAAMVLAKKHIQRLWYPKPGEGGDIATRSRFSLTDEEFDRLIPVEFWRELVDRMAHELPNTLLLAEAFWMLEGYFVRSLGMHRVYNSAFMHMLMKEDNGEYRKTIKNTQEFDPGILKRFVNFMSNPDEKTAIEQFGIGDKYFGVCAMMCSMPGLPMFAHGQIEGFTEKYGMEYAKAYYDEHENSELILRHEHEIFPLLRHRYLFANCEEFRLYDVYQRDGTINENVYAYSNGEGGQHIFFAFNNSINAMQGYVNQSSPYRVKLEGDSKHLSQQSLAQSLALHNDDRYFLILHDQLTGLDYLRSSYAIHHDGLYMELNGYQHQLFWQIEELYDDDGTIAQLCYELNGHSIANIKLVLAMRRLAPVHQAIPMLFHSHQNIFVEAFVTAYHLKKEPLMNEQVDKLMAQLRCTYPEPIFLEKANQLLLQHFNQLNSFIGGCSEIVKTILGTNPSYLPFAASWVVTSALCGFEKDRAGWLFDDLLLSQTLKETWHHYSWGNYLVFHDSLQFFSGFASLPTSIAAMDAASFWLSLINSPHVASLCGFNYFGDNEWFSQEKTRQFCDLLMIILYLKVNNEAEMLKMDKFNKAVTQKIAKADYKVAALREGL